MSASAPRTHPGIAIHQFRSMGTDVSVLLPPEEFSAARSVERLFDDWDQRFSRFMWDSELMRVNRAAGKTTPVSPQMFDVASAALAAARATDGLFDPLLSSRMAELGYDRSFDHLPPDRAPAELRPWRAGEWRSVEVDRGTRSLRLPAGCGLDLGGLAKGMAVDAALDLLVASGAEYAAVNAGGDLAVHGLPPDDDRWAIEIEGDPPRVVGLRDGALATSSVLRRRWLVDGVARHHLLDPRTGMPVDNGIAQASVSAATCRQAEVAAKAAMLLGPVGAADFIERHGLSALLMTRGGEEIRLGAWS